MDFSSLFKGSRSLRKQFSLSVLALLTLLSTILLYLLVWTAGGIMVKQTVAQGASLTKTVASTSSYYVLFNLKDNLNEIIASTLQDPSVEYVDFLDSEGKVITQGSQPGARRPSAFAGGAEGKEMSGQEVNDGKRLFLFVRTLQEKKDGTIAGGAQTIGHLRMAINDSSYRQARKTLLKVAVPVTAVVLAFSVGLVLMGGSGLIVSPILKLEESASIMARGDLTQRVEEDRADEIGELSKSFNKMARNLEQMVSQVKGGHGRLTRAGEVLDSASRMVRQRADAQTTVLEDAYFSIEKLNGAIRKISENVENLSSSSEETSSSVLEMVASMEEVSKHTDSLYDSVEVTATSTQEMVSSINEVDRNMEYLGGFVNETSASMMEMDASITEVEVNASRSYELSLDVAHDAESGMKAVRETMEGMDMIRGAVNETEGVIGRLGGKSEEIGNILNVIEEIAEQTNLLALNAAILAAQAGEHGKGFAVVAGEIRQLSERTATSTKEISNLIRAVQDEVKNAVKSMKAGTLSVGQGVNLASEAGRALNKILESAMKSSNTVKEIANATKEQAKGSQSVTSAIERVNEMVRQINTATSQQSAGSSHIMAAVENMREITKYVKQATLEQKSGSIMISKATERMMEMIHEILETTSQQTLESERIVHIMEKVKEISNQNKKSVDEMQSAIRQLGDHTQALEEEMKIFKLRA